MKYIFLSINLFLGFIINAQTSYEYGNVVMGKRVYEPIIVKKDTFYVDDKLKLGTGQNTNGEFRYVYYLNSFNEPIKKAGTRANHFEDKIKFFKYVQGKYYVYTKLFLIEIEDALISKEVASKYNYETKPETKTISVADELKKFKELLDAGAITKEEYEQQKKKLLGE